MTLPAEALRLLADWLPGNDDPERPRMQLATVDASGLPDIRTVLLSEWDETGFFLHTDANSRKVAQLASFPGVALDLLWPGFARQLVVQGRAERADGDEERRVYARRSPYLRQLAWQNTAEVAQLPREERTRQWAEFADAHDIAALEAPATWVGYRVRPSRLTFWEADPEGPSHRVEFGLSDEGWARFDLPG
ncbi:pyridoxamine 5'-phosphate oxidase family protein [Naasia sp. SYSU D00057]|uniref:pyridoxamine 5'-phosphate oxidase family protein n=1 Tax=Naasia sp. SYSU D00057 TaxID=2817380 RepID=UPI001B302CF1|nr:pyridoxamine 5'-phosphate oxidase family protein [Naasia sp. SYSU D00057]